MPQKTKSNRNDVQVKWTEKACFLCHDAAVIIQIEFYQKWEITKNRINRTHLKMRTGKRQTLVAQWLLAVFLSVLLTTWIHVHPESEGGANPCVECVKHIHHDGHLSASGFSISHCLVCQFCALSYLPIAFIVLGTAFSLAHRVLFSNHSSLYGNKTMCLSGRAPPYLSEQ